MIYLDNSATTYPKPEEVYLALDYANRNLAFNSGRGSYPASAKATKIIDKTRVAVSALVGADASSVAFLSSATECLNVIINGLALDDGDTVYISPFEHNAIVRPLFEIKEEKNIDIVIIPFDKRTWKPDLEKLDEMLFIRKPKAILVSQISNVTGLMLDYQGIFNVGKKHEAITVLDSAQAYGVINPDLRNVDFCVFAGHKSLYASFGVAGIVSNKFDILKVVKSGGTGSDSINHYMPSKGYGRVESGSPNVVAIYGLLASIKWLNENDVSEKEKELTMYAIDKLGGCGKVQLYLPEDLKSVNGIISFNVEGYRPEDAASILSDEYDICVRAGFHCSPFVHDFIGSEMRGGTIRMSLGAFNSPNDIDNLIKALVTL